MQAEFRNLVHEHRDGIYTFAFYSLGDADEAEDVTQEVLVRLWRHFETLKPETLPAWIRKVTRNACIDMIRRKRAYESRVVANGEADPIGLATSSEPMPDGVLYATELRATIREALALMKEPFRSIVVLREVQDMKYDEICEAMNLPLNTVKSYLHRGRRMLREKLSETLNHESQL